MDRIQERLIPSKYYGKSSKRLIQTSGEELINHKLLNVYICNKGICSANLSSKIILRNSFIVLTDVLFNLILPFSPKEIDSFNNVTILKDINERKIYRTERSLSSLKIEILLDDQLTENDKKKVRQNKETEICSYSPIVLLQRHQPPYAKELSRKGVNDGNMNAIFFNQFEWTDSMIEVLNKIIINDIIVSLNTHITDVLIVEVLTDSPLLIIKENINCGNFLNNEKFNFLIDRINYNSLTDFPINERLYGEALFHIFLQNERYNIAYRTNRIIIDLVNILKSNHSNTNRLYHDYSNTTTTQQEHKGV